MMKLSQKLKLYFGLGSAILCLYVSVASAQDRVFTKQGVPASGKITKITPDEVVINVRSKDQTYPMVDVRKVTFDGEPSGLDRARELVIEGQYDQAMEELKKLTPASMENPLARQDFEYYRWYCEGKLGLAGSGDKNAAIRGLIAVAGANRNTHHLYELSELLGELALAVGQADKAVGYFGILSKSPSPEAKASSVYHLGLVYLSQGKIAEAKSQFVSLASAAASSPEMARLKSWADVGVALCENEEGNSQKALESLNAMVQKYDSTDQRLFARINNARGACYTKLNQTKQALYSYLQTDLLFFTDPELHAEALYHLKKLWPTVGESAKAAEAGERLTNRYAASVWANKP